MSSAAQANRCQVSIKRAKMREQEAEADRSKSAEKAYFALARALDSHVTGTSKRRKEEVRNETSRLHAKSCRDVFENCLDKDSDSDDEDKGPMMGMNAEVSITPAFEQCDANISYAIPSDNACDEEETGAKQNTSKSHDIY
jgi:hypothetical protein